MCGIFGGYNIDKNLKNNIINQLSHRGPDGSGFYSIESENILLCHTRLSIIDTSKKGLQPMTDITGNYVIIFNGERSTFAEGKTPGGMTTSLNLTAKEYMKRLFRRSTSPSSNKYFHYKEAQVR